MWRKSISGSQTSRDKAALSSTGNYPALTDLHDKESHVDIYMKSKRTSRAVVSKPVTRKTVKKSTSTKKTAKVTKSKKLNLEILILCGLNDEAAIFLAQLKKIHVDTPTDGTVVVYRDVCPEKLTKTEVITACAAAGLTKDKFDVIITTKCSDSSDMFWPNVASLLKKGGVAIGPIMSKQWGEAASSESEKELIQELRGKYKEGVNDDHTDQRLAKAEKVIASFSPSKRALIADVRMKVADLVTSSAPSLKMLPVKHMSIAAYQKM